MSKTDSPINHNSQINQNSTTINPKKPNTVYLIVLSILSFFIAILGVANIVIYINNGFGNHMTQFEDLTKEEALAFMRAQTDVTGTLPNNYVGEEIYNSFITNGDTIIVYLDLIYSYDTTEDLKEMARKKYKNDHFEIKEYDYYAIVTPEQARKGASCNDDNDDWLSYGCTLFLSFKRSYLDHHMEETTPNSHNEVFYFNTQDPDIINYLLRVCSIFSSVGFGGGHGNIYSYNFEEQDDKYILTINNVGAGINVEALDDPSVNKDISKMIAINLYRRRLAADKSDGKMYYIPTNTGVMEHVKSFPITEEEFKTLPGYDFIK